MKKSLKRFALGAAAAGVMSISGATVALADTLTVQPGDSLWSIAHNHGVTVGALEAANPAVNPMNLQIGSTLNIPGNSKYSSNDVYWLSRLIHAEAVGESYDTQVAVGDVVVHRTQVPGYANTIPGVIFQVSNGHYQFTPVENGYIYTTPTAENIQAAKEVLFSGVDLVPGAQVFYNSAQTPASSWVRTQPTVAVLGHLTFAK